MTEPEEGRATQKKDRNDGDETAAAKLWAVYVSEAEKYDKSLVETWKSDMEGLLIFAALFSAILTAFIIESYKSLTPDPSDLTVQLLGQISQQLAAVANGTTFHMTPPTPFQPTVASLICNALWFISLGFSLACALIATLIQQWARDFLHKADMRSAPIIRARVFSFLYYGLRRFQMHTVVEVIPLLLHASLLLFFCGLVAFLIPVNITMTAIAAIVLVIVAASYSTLTLLPLRYLDCPYRTPLSGALWWTLRNFKKTWCRCRTQSPESLVESHSGGSDSPEPILFTDETMVEVMSRTATEYSDERQERDYKALVWTVKSLSDDAELEPFVEALADLLWGPTRTSYRIGNLLMTCDTGILAPDASQRRQITCLKALWALASLATLYSMSAGLTPLDFSHMAGSSLFRRLGNSITAPYITSARALMGWSTFLALEGRLTELQDRLVACERDAVNNSAGNPELQGVAESFLQIRRQLSTVGILSSAPSPAPLNLRSWIEKYLSNDARGQINFDFLANAGSWESPPYRFDESYRALYGSRTLPAFRQYEVGGAIHLLVSTHMERMNNTPYQETEWIHKTLLELLSFWQPTDTDCIPRGIIVFLNERQSEDCLVDILLPQSVIRATTETHLWDCFPRTLLKGAAPPLSLQPRPPPLPLEDVFTALWCLSYIGVDRSGQFWHLQSLESVLKAVLDAEPRFTQISLSIIALLKLGMLSNSWSTSGEQFDRIFQTFFTGSLNRSEARLALIAEYLECCASNLLPYNAVKTVYKLTRQMAPREPVHPTHQLRLANSIQPMSFAVENSTELSQAIMHSDCWKIYATGRKTEKKVTLHRNKLNEAGWGRWPWPWLDDPIARQKVKQVFTDYETKLTASGDSPDILARLQFILEGIDSWHPEGESSHTQRRVPESDIKVDRLAAE